MEPGRLIFKTWPENIIPAYLMRCCMAAAHKTVSAKDEFSGMVPVIIHMKVRDNYRNRFGNIIHVHSNEEENRAYKLICFRGIKLYVSIKFGNIT